MMLSTVNVTMRANAIAVAKGYLELSSYVLGVNKKLSHTAYLIHVFASVSPCLSQPTWTARPQLVLALCRLASATAYRENVPFGSLVLVQNAGLPENATRCPTAATAIPEVALSLRLHRTHRSVNLQEAHVRRLVIVMDYL